MISYFDHRFGTYEGQTQAQARQGKLPEFNQEQHARADLLTLPEYWIHNTHLPKYYLLSEKYLLAFRSIVRSTDYRTFIPSVLPLVGCGDTLQIIRISTEQDTKLICLYTCLSSFVFDYIARQKLGGVKMSFFVVKQLPIFLPSFPVERRSPFSTSLRTRRCLFSFIRY
jgi:hypothetical protein